MMKGLLWCGDEELEIQFGVPIEQNDKIGLLLQLTDTDLKFFIMINH